MIQSIRIKNFALVDECEIEFTKGLNIITGETGAGKSILVDAISALLGARTSAAMLRHGEKKAIIEGSFNSVRQGNIKNYCEENDLDYHDDQLLLRRELLANGRSRAFVNDSPATLAQVQSLAQMLVDVHGQHEHQSLLKPADHIEYLDIFGNLAQAKEQVSRFYTRIKEERSKLEKLLAGQQKMHERKDYLLFQLQEINKIDPQPDEEQSLIAEEKKLAHSQELRATCGETLSLLFESEHAAVNSLGKSVRMLESILAYDENLPPILDDLNTALIATEEACQALQRYIGHINADPAKLDETRNRLGQLSFIKKKHGATIEEILSLQKTLKNELCEMESLADLIVKSREKKAAADKAYIVAARKLSRARIKAAKSLESAIPGLLSQIGMEQCRFSIDMSQIVDGEEGLDADAERIGAQRNGIDRVEFSVQTNPGQPARRLQQVASGGEISRIMLALKSVIAEKDKIPVLLFDEIDSGISGRIAQRTAGLLRKLARSHQIICITHLPQIASAGDSHFLVEKLHQDETTSTRIRKLSQQEQAEAIARLMGGDVLQDTHLESAKTLIYEARQL